MNTKGIFSIASSCILALAAPAWAESDLERAFVTPPDTTRPRCYWYWMDGQITKTGITRDLEAMKRVGIGEGYIGIISGQAGTPAGSGSAAFTDEWWGFIEHAIREGTRLGVDIGLFNSPGWSQSGGPWVKPSAAMRYLTLPELRLRGPQRFAGKLPLPAGEFQDLALLAFPVPAGEGEVAKITARTPTLVSFEMPSAFTARSVTVVPIKPVNVTAELLAADDGKQFRTVKTFTIDRHNLAVGVGPVPLAPIVVTLPATTARFFQLKLSAACELGDIQLSPAARVEDHAGKSLLKVFQDPLPPADFYSWPKHPEPNSRGLTIQPEAVLDLTGRMAADGTLDWEVPPGDWIVMRTALTPTGTKNSPAPKEATGLEVDKMNRTALKAHFDAYIGHLLKRMPAADRKSWKHVVADSYETGPQNWTDGFAGTFKQRYGYDPMRFLPVMTGRVVGSVDQSDRFLWDLRRLVADRVAREYVGALRDLCNENGLKMWLENYGHWGFPAEFLQYGGASDEIGGEYWVTGDLGSIECRAASSAAHTYGKPVVWAEAFTGGPAFVNTPRDLKLRGDWSFCEGINQFTLHVYIHQPWEDRVPGINAWFGTEFNRHNTWFEQSKAWIDYLRRCSVLLQAGNQVADVAYFIGEDAPKMTGQRKPELPAGYDFDYINADVVENRLAVKDGRFVLPDGMSYRLLVLPEGTAMRPAVLNRLRGLVADGGVVFGLPPSASPSLEKFPQCDEIVRKLAREVWGASGLKQPGERAFGKGRVMWGRGLPEVLKALCAGPDFESSEKVRFTHRRSAGADIYFVANPKGEPLETTAAFRMDGRAPEFWWPDSGRIERPAVYEVADGRVRLPLSFGPADSVFVVFRDQAVPPSGRIVSVIRDNQELIGTSVRPAAGEAAGDHPNNFSFAVWVKPADATTLVREANSSIVGMAEKRNEVFAAPHGNTFRGVNPAGCGLAVGTNGVCVFEHGAGYFAPPLVHAAPLADWTHVAVVYRDGQPSLYLNGKLARTGLKSTHTVHAGNARGDPTFRGKVGSIERFSRSLSPDQVARLVTLMRQPSVGTGELPLQLTRDAAGGINAQGGQAGEYHLKFADGRMKILNVAPTPAPQEITGPWEVSFEPGAGAPEKVAFDSLTDWTQRPEEGIRHFSGKATYRRTFEVPGRLASCKALVLDLGEVNDIAVVRLNGREPATLWRPPYRLDITSAVRSGANTLEVVIVNTWNNRLVGDASLPSGQRSTFLTAPTVGKNTPLHPAGLLGPVLIRGLPHP